MITGQSTLRKELKERRQPARTSAPRTTPKPVPVEDDDDPALTDECPEPNGFFADGYQCDKYYECRDNVITEKLCPDGMVFNDFSPKHEKCDLPFGIDCSQRPERRKWASLLKRALRISLINANTIDFYFILFSRNTPANFALS